MVDIKKNDHMHLHPTTRRCSFFFIKKAGSRGWERAGWLDHWEASFRNPSQTGGHALCLPRSCFSSVGQEAWNTVWWKSVYALALEPVPDSCCRLVLPIHATCSSRWAGRQAPPGWATGGGGVAHRPSLLQDPGVHWLAFLLDTGKIGLARPLPPPPNLVKLKYSPPPRGTANP